MTRDDSQSCLAFSEEHWHCWHSSLLSYALLGTIQSELSTTLKLSPRPSSTQGYPITGLYNIGTLAFTFHKTAPTVGLETKLTPSATRNETGGDASKPLRNIAYCLFAPSVKRYSRNRIASKYHYHASAYSLQTVCCHFMYLHEANTDDTGNWSRLPG